MISRILKVFLLFLSFSWPAGAQLSTIKWQERVIISEVPVFEGARGKYGSEYARLLQLSKKHWLAAYTVASNYTDSSGTYRLILQISRSGDRGKSWKKISEIAYPGRDVDNAQLLKLTNGDILLACRSTRFGETYWLPVYKSADKGISWKLLSIIDVNEGKPGELSKPDKGIYEPHLNMLQDGRLAVMYANEKHVADTPSYSQIISEKISDDGGNTWGKEIWVAYEPNNNSSRPGMPVWTRMKDGRYIVVYEICGPQNCSVYYKISNDGINWPIGLGTIIPGQTGGPYILSLNDGRLVVTSNRANISISDDFGSNWYLAERPWQHKESFEKTWYQTYWPSLYQMRKKQVGAVASVIRDEGGHNVQIRFGKISRPKRK